MNIVCCFNELSIPVQQDVLAQFDSPSLFEEDQNPDDFLYELITFKYQEIIDYLDEILGPNLLDYMYDDDITELAQDITQNGLRNPPVGMEGFHRMLAFAYLERDMPYYKIIRKEATSE